MTLARVCSLLEFDSAMLLPYTVVLPWRKPKLTRAGNGMGLDQGIYEAALATATKGPEISAAFNAIYFLFLFQR